VPAQQAGRTEFLALGLAAEVPVTGMDYEIMIRGYFVENQSGKRRDPSSRISEGLAAFGLGLPRARCRLLDRKSNSIGLRNMKCIVSRHF
jgi:hypothetical protein